MEVDVIEDFSPTIILVKCKSFSVKITPFTSPRVRDCLQGRSGGRSGTFRMTYTSEKSGILPPTDMGKRCGHNIGRVLFAAASVRDFERSGTLRMTYTSEKSGILPPTDMGKRCGRNFCRVLFAAAIDQILGVEAFY